jgi:hypothetical protein
VTDGQGANVGYEPQRPIIKALSFAVSRLRCEVLICSWSFRGDTCGGDFARRKSGRIANRAAKQVRAGHQSQDRKGT